uniref:Uncharacterized protein n=1 Tax=viral metagenome TaxID=1070528 RepID=A0A6H2A3C7_9ZZZZ
MIYFIAGVGTTCLFIWALKMLSKIDLSTGEARKLDNNELAVQNCKWDNNEWDGYYKLGIGNTANPSNVSINDKTIAIPELVKEMHHD